MFEDIQTYRCPTCTDIILIVLPGDTVDEYELVQKIEKHQQKHTEFEATFSD